MGKQSTLNQEGFDSLLSWLDPDRGKAALRYEEIRRSLIKIFAWRGMPDAEGLADETFNRVIGHLPDLPQTYVGDPGLYFYGVAKKIILEQERLLREHATIDRFNPSQPPLPEQEDTSEREYECLQRCLDLLPPASKDFILSYYSAAKRQKIDRRKELAQSLAIDMNALRVRAHRIRATLEQCIMKCLEGAESKQAKP